MKIKLLAGRMVKLRSIRVGFSLLFI
jgi:hypothetical protein